jgi:hypothetical protein
VFYYRSDNISGRPPEVSRFVSDAKCLLALSPEAITALSADLESQQGFLDRDALSRAISRHIADEEQVRQLTRLVQGYDDLVNRFDLTLGGILKSIDNWRVDQDDEEETPPLSDADFRLLGERMPLLLKQYDGLVRQDKAERLSEVLGHRLESIDVICDLRPVFDQNHTGVVGVIPLTTLKLVCTGGNGLPVTTEAILSEKQVSELAAVAQSAVKKLSILRGLVAEVHKPIPMVPVTEPVPSAEQGNP